MLMKFSRAYRHVALKPAARALRAVALLAAGVSAGALIPQVAVAQDFTNITASGRVQGTDGKPVAGATVRITSNDQGFSLTTQTDGGGVFKFPQIRPGSYAFAITADGFLPLADPAVRLNAGDSANQFTLASATASASNGDIVVTAGRQRVINFDSTTTGKSVDVTDLQTRVPIGRDLASVVLLSPGTAAGDTAFNSDGTGNLVAINGASVSENQFFINGLDITNFRTGLGSSTIPFEFYQTVDVKNGGYPAEFGRSTGGFISATTKSGSNDFHAGAVIAITPNALYSKAPNTYQDDNDNDYRQTIESNFYLSGPIIKDHLFFYGLYTPRYSKQGDGSITAGTYSTKTSSSPFFGGKVDAVITDGQRLEFTYFRNRQTYNTSTYIYDPDTNTQSGYKGNTVNKYGGNNFVGRYTGKFADWITVSGAYGKSIANSSSAPGGTNAYVVDYRSGTGKLLGNSAVSVSENKDTREFFRGDVDLYFKLLGSHHVRGGYDRENLTSYAESAYVAGTAYSYYLAKDGNRYAPAGTEYVAARTYFNGGTFKTRNEAFYLEDDWSMFGNRLNLQLGIRDDRFVDRNVNGEVYYRSGDQWGPRLGFTFDPTGSGKTKVWGYYGRTFLPVPTNTNIRLAGAESDYTQYYTLAGVNADGSPVLGTPLTGYVNSTANCPGTTVANCTLVSDGTATPTGATVAKNLKPQAVDNYILGIERRVGERMRFSLYGTYNKLVRSLEDAAIDQAVLKYCTANGISGCDDIWTGFHQYVLINPGSAMTITLSDPINGEATARTIAFSAADLGYVKAKRTYKALTATFDREFDGRWSLSASYTWSKTVGNIEGGVKSDNGQTDSGLTTDFDQPGFTYGAYGNLPNDHRHNFKLYGSYLITPNINIGAQIQVQSPRSFGCIGLVPDSVDAFASAYGAAGHYCPLSDGEVSDTNPVILVPRGSVFKSDWNKQLDLSFVYRPYADNSNLQFQLDVVNVLNFQSKLDYNEVGTDDGGAASATYRLPISYQTPRHVTFTARIGF